MSNLSEMPSMRSAADAFPEKYRHAVEKSLAHYEKYRLTPEKLRCAYSDEELEKVEAAVAARERTFEQSGGGEIGKVAEALFHMNVNGGARLFGERAKATLLSAYDDYGLSLPANREERGAYSDAAVELFPRESETPRDPYRFVAGIDVTANTNPKALDLKLMGIKTALDTGRLATVAYFLSEEPRFGYRYAGPLKKIPKAVVALAADTDSLLRLAELTDKAESGSSPDQKTLRADPVSRVTLAELLLQFDAFREYAKRSAHDPETAQKFDDGIARLKEIVKEKHLTAAQLSERSVLAHPALQALGKALLRLNFYVRRPSDIL